MAYSVRHLTSFRYEPAVRESVMEVRMQPRTDFRQRCLSFSLNIDPRANTMMYRDFYGNAVHNFDIPERHRLIEVTAQAIVDVLSARMLDANAVGDWKELDERVAQTDYWEMLLPSQFAMPTRFIGEIGWRVGSAEARESAGTAAGIERQAVRDCSIMRRIPLRWIRRSMTR